MQLPQPLLERANLLPGGLADDLSFLILFDPALPSIHRGHDGQDVHARGEALFDERPGNALGVASRSERGQDEDDLCIGV